MLALLRFCSLLILSSYHFTPLLDLAQHIRNFLDFPLPVQPATLLLLPAFPSCRPPYRTADPTPKPTERTPPPPPTPPTSRPPLAVLGIASLSPPFRPCGIRDTDGDYRHPSSRQGAFLTIDTRQRSNSAAPPTASTTDWPPSHASKGRGPLRSCVWALQS